MDNSKQHVRTIELVPHDSRWAESFAVEAAKLRGVLADNCCAIHHIGSTAIPGIYAKPIIDILVEVHDLSVIDQLNPRFEKLAYMCMGEYGIKARRFYWKDARKRTHHIHLFETGHADIARHLAFRDYLIKHPDFARSYSWLKRCLAEQLPTDMSAYLDAKDVFIRTVAYYCHVAKSDQLQATDQIVLESFNANWPKWAAAEIATIKHIVNLPFAAIEHLGSTAVEGLRAKPVLDIFIALDDMADAKRWTQPLLSLGYIDWPENPDKNHARFFKGMPPYGLQRYAHVHIMPMGEEFMQRIRFKELLCAHADVRDRYVALKTELAAKYQHDREAYTTAKLQFINTVLGLS